MFCREHAFSALVRPVWGVSTLFPCPQIGVSTLFPCSFGLFRVSAHFFRANKLGSGHFFCARTVLSLSSGPSRPASTLFPCSHWDAFFPFTCFAVNAPYPCPFDLFRLSAPFPCRQSARARLFRAVALLWVGTRLFRARSHRWSTQRSRRGRRPMGWWRGGRVVCHT